MCWMKKKNEEEKDGEDEKKEAGKYGEDGKV